MHTARWWAAALSLLGVALVGHVGAATGLGSTARCETGWIALRQGLGEALLCGVDAVAEAVQDCAHPAAVRAGQRLTVVGVGAACVVVVAEMPGQQRLRLGLGLDVNRASSVTLALVSGIGPAMAGRIIAGRPYVRLAALERVRGIGPRRRAAWSASLRVAPWPSQRWPASSTPRTPSGSRSSSAD